MIKKGKRAVSLLERIRERRSGAEEEYVANKMRISFDLDEVLFVSPKTHKTEPPLPQPLNRIYRERLRLGTVHLIRRLQKEHFEVWIYTSSFRSEKYIRRLFYHYGIHLDEVVNGERHQREVQRNRTDRLPDKLPNRYRISLHVDDEPIVADCGRLYGFNVYQLNAPDDEWEEKIMQKLYQIRRRERPDLVPKEEKNV